MSSTSSTVELDFGTLYMKRTRLPVMTLVRPTLPASARILALLTSPPPLSTTSSGTSEIPSAVR